LETQVAVDLAVDGSGAADVQTGLGFLDHMLAAFVRHSAVDLRLRCSGDLHVDDHHTVEDCGLALGAAIDAALGERLGIRRFASAYAPLDESLVRAVVDLSGRPGAWIDLPFRGPRLGVVATENLVHFFRSLAMSLRATLHVDTIRSENDHHLAEAAFKAVALALRSAVERVGSQVPSTKGVL
jgi:imidazoleglycerol-phosphate dehydratase